MKPLRANPGGQIPIEAIVGRDVLIERIWDALKRQSLLMTAERRIGKTQILRKMEVETPKGWTAVRTDLEAFHTANEFTGAVFDEVQKHLALTKRFANRTKKLLSDLGDTTIANVLTLPKGSWKKLLAHCIEDLVEEQGDRKLVFFWDEMPFMLRNIGNREGQDTAMEILDVLRALRQEHDGFRMILTGSLGLHHVINELKREGYGNAPVNDMRTIEIPPLDPVAGRELANALLRGEGLACPDLDDAARAIAEAADSVPFYIHHIVAFLSHESDEITRATVEAAVARQMLDANDPWELAHYRTRIATYYGDQSDAVVAILDALATSSRPLGVDAVLRSVMGQMPFDGRDSLLTLLKLMERDHYLVRAGDGFRIRFPLIARWWRLDRELASPAGEA